MEGRLTITVVTRETGSYEPLPAQGLQRTQTDQKHQHSPSHKAPNRTQRHHQSNHNSTKSGMSTHSRHSSLQPPKQVSSRMKWINRWIAGATASTPKAKKGPTEGVVALLRSTDWPEWVTNAIGRKQSANREAIGRSCGVVRVLSSGYFGR